MFDQIFFNTWLNSALDFISPVSVAGNLPKDNGLVYQESTFLLVAQRHSTTPN